MVAHLVAREWRRQVPIITVAYLGKSDDSLDLPGYQPLSGTKAVTFLPQRLGELKDRRVLLLDDFVMSGDGPANAVGACSPADSRRSASGAAPWWRPAVDRQQERARLLGPRNPGLRFLLSVGPSRVRPLRVSAPLMDLRRLVVSWTGTDPGPLIRSFGKIAATVHRRARTLE
jgi:hypothetical protein